MPRGNTIGRQCIVGGSGIFQNQSIAAAIDHVVQNQCTSSRRRVLDITLAKIYGQTAIGCGRSVGKRAAYLEFGQRVGSTNADVAAWHETHQFRFSATIFGIKGKSAGSDIFASDPPVIGIVGSQP